MLKMVFIILAIFLFLFIFWKKLRDDCGYEEIFASAFYILIGLLAGLLLTSYFFPNWWFWISFFGSSLGLLIAIIRFKLMKFETIEAWVLASIPFMGLVLLYDWIQNRNVSSGAGFLIIFTLFILFLFIDKYYKSFSWYKSGKIGFSGLTILGLFFLIRAAIAAFLHDMLSFVGKADIFFSAIIAFTCYLLVFNLARKET